MTDDDDDLDRPITQRDLQNALRSIRVDIKDVLIGIMRIQSHLNRQDEMASIRHDVLVEPLSNYLDATLVTPPADLEDLLATLDGTPKDDDKSP